MAPPSGRFTTPEAPAASSSELLPAAAPSELLPAATQSELFPTTNQFDLLPKTSSRPCPTSAPLSWLSIHGERSSLPVEYQLARLSALAARANVASSSRQSTSPGLHRQRRQGSSSPLPRIAQGELHVQEGEGQKSKKRKSPCGIMPPFPLSRMMLSPRTQVLAPWMRSPSVTHEMSPSTSTCDTPYGQGQRLVGEIDLNMTPEDCREELLGQEDGNNENVGDQLYQDNEDDQLIQENEDDQLDQENAHDQGDQQDGNNENGDDQLYQQDNEDDQLNQENEDDQLVQDNAHDQIGQQHARKNLSVPTEKRRLIFETLLGRARNGVLNGNDKKDVSIQFSVPLRTVQRIWKKGKDCLDEGLPADVSSGKSKCGRKKKEVNVSILRDISVASRMTLQDVAQQLGVSVSKVQNLRKEGAVKRVSNSIKPYLTEKNKKDRLKWCLSMIDPRSVPHDPMFRGLFDYVFIDEKWFYMTRKTMRYYTTPGDPEPIRTCKSTNYIPKIHVLTAFAHPRFENNECTFDGKIGCFPFVTYEAAKRSSVNRPAGTIEMKLIEVINRDVMRSFMIQKVLPAIRAKWPREDINKPIYIQQDNAKPHVKPNDALFCEAAKQDGFDIRLICQPSNSPDLNVLDLDFFNSIQSVQYKTTSRTLEELVSVVNEAFANYSPRLSNRIFLTLHGCMKKIMKLDGGNGYDVPHIRKGMLERQGHLPVQLKCEASLVEEVMAKINE